MTDTHIVDIQPAFTPGAKILVIGAGWAGNKAINRMINEWIDSVDFIAVNTDAQDLAQNLAPNKINIWLNITKGLWAWAEPEIGRKAAEESIEDIKKSMKDADMVFITAGMGGGTGTGAAPVIAQCAKEQGILTVAIVTTPFSFEGKTRLRNAEAWLEKLRPSVDTIITIPNDKIFTVADKKTTFKQAFSMIDKILYLGVQGISDLIIKPGDINLDFADIKVIMKDSGNAMLGIGYGVGEKRAVDAARQAIENPFLDADLKGSKNIIFAVTGWPDLTPIEVQEAASVIEDIMDDEVNLIWGMTFDESYEDEVKVTVIATGFEEIETSNILKKPQRDEFGRKIAKKPAENFITRTINENNQSRQNTNTTTTTRDEDDTDYETPSFMRKKIQK